MRSSWIFLLALLAVLPFQGSRGLWEADEGRYTAVALEMLHHGDPIVPILHPDQPHLSKPPLTYWALAGSLALVGRNEWAARLPNALAFAITVALVAELARLLALGRPEEAALIYATSVLPWAAASVVTTDTLLTLWETLAVLGYAGARFGGAGARGMLLLWIGLGLAFLTKGPPGLLPLAAILAFEAFGRERRDPGGPRVISIPGLAVFAALAGGWLALLEWRLPGVTAYLLRREVAERIFTDVHHRHGAWWQAVSVYGPALVGGSLPWLWVGRRALVGSLARWREDPRRAFLGLWLAVPAAVLVLARSRLPLYVLPLMPPLALLFAAEIGARRKRPGLVSQRGGWLHPAVAAWLAVLILAKLAVAHLPDHRDARAYARHIETSVPVPFDEIEFVDTRPHYGLALYLGVEIESSTLGEPGPFEGRWGHRPALDERLDPTARRLFILKRKRLPELREIARARGLRARVWGEYSNDLLVSIEPAA